MTIVSSSINSTVRERSLRPRFSPLLLAPSFRPRRQLMSGPFPAEMEACDRQAHALAGGLDSMGLPQVVH